MEIEKLKLERKFFNGKSTGRNDERIILTKAKPMQATFVLHRL